MAEQKMLFGDSVGEYLTEVSDKELIKLANKEGSPETKVYIHSRALSEGLDNELSARPYLGIEPCFVKKHDIMEPKEEAKVKEVAITPSPPQVPTGSPSQILDPDYNVAEILLVLRRIEMSIDNYLLTS